jgi:hypothetical protein
MTLTSTPRQLLVQGAGMMLGFAWLPRHRALLTAQEDGVVQRVDLRAAPVGLGRSVALH